MPVLKLAKSTIGGDAPVFLIAEAGVNHNGELALAHRLIDAAVDAGANAVKFQTFITEENIRFDAPLAAHHVANVGEDMSHYDLIKKLELPFDAFGELKTHCEDRNVVFLSTPYDLPSTEFLVDLGCEAVKVASSEMSNFPLLNILGSANVPVLLSTGMSRWQEIDDSVRFLTEKGSPLCVLKCTSNYPAAAKTINLRGITRMREAFPDCVIGFSDHSEGIEISLAALGFGAQLIERHFTLDPDAWGPDHKASLSPEEFKNLAGAVRLAEMALGEDEWNIQDDELFQRNTMRKGAYARRDIRCDETVTLDDVKFLRPPTEIGPKEFFLYYQGRQASRDIAAGEALGVDSFAGKEK